MIDKKIYDEIKKKWAEVGKIYQTWRRIEKRMPILLRNVDLLEGKDVLEFGCNAGVYGYEISRIAKSYFGVDAGDHFIEQAKITKTYMENPNVDFQVGKVKDFIKAELSRELQIPYNALFASYLLYHLSNKEVELLSRYVLPKCDVVLFPIRTKKRKIWRVHNWYFFYKPENVEKFLSKNGFECSIDHRENKRLAVIIGKRA